MHRAAWAGGALLGALVLAGAGCGGQSQRLAPPRPPVFADASALLPAAPSAVAALEGADLDGDGSLDRIALAGGGALRLLARDAAGAWTDRTAACLPSPAALLGSPAGVLWLDAEGDGPLELLVLAAPRAATLTSAPAPPASLDAGISSQSSVPRGNQPFLLQKLSGNPPQQGLIALPDAELARLPAGARVDSARLELYQFGLPAFPGTAYGIFAHIDRPFDPATVTWASWHDPALPTPTAAVPAAVLGVADGKKGLRRSFEIAPLVQGWHAGTLPNYGMTVSRTAGPADVTFLASEVLTSTGPLPKEPPRFVIEYTAAREALLRQNGGGQLVLDPDALPARPPRRALAAAAGEIDGHPGAELLVAYDDGTLALLVRDGTGRCLDEGPSRLGPALPPELAGATVTAAAWLDLEGDGDLDLVLAPEANPLVVCLNNGTGSFVPAPPGTAPALPLAVSALAAADLDRDGLTDLVLATRSGDGLVLLLNAAGTLIDRSALLPAQPAEPLAVRVADLNGDGELDLLAIDALGPPLLLLRGPGGVFFDASVALPPLAPGQVQAALAGDLDGDGRTDLYLAGQGFHMLLAARRR